MGGAKICAVCGDADWQRYCQVCFCHVCGKCSQSTVYSPERSVLQRICNTCAAFGSSGPAFLTRIEDLGERLHGIAEMQFDSSCQVNTMAEAFELCEKTLPLIQEKCRVNVSGGSGANSSVIGSLMQVGTRLRHLNGGNDTLLDIDSVDDVVNFCQQQLNRLEEVINCEQKDPVSYDDDSDGSSPCSEPSTPSRTCGICAVPFSNLCKGQVCRICRRQVCKKCCPNCVYFEGQKCQQKVCTHCVGQAAKIPEMQNRLANVGCRICVLANVKEPLLEVNNLEEAVRVCENALMPLESLKRKDPVLDVDFSLIDIPEYYVRFK